MSDQIDLSYLGLLNITGPDAKRFLQGQLTCHLEEISLAHSQLGAHCNPAGRVISLFRLFLYQNSYYLQMPIPTVPLALAALQKYAIFFKVHLADASHYLKEIACHLRPDPPEQWHYLDLMANIPAIYPETSEKFLPHDINLPLLNAVSFNKGCFTGQEIIARMHYRGKLKKHLERQTIMTDQALQRGQLLEQGTLVDYCQIGYNQYEILIIIPNETEK